MHTMTRREALALGGSAAVAMLGGGGVLAQRQGGDPVGDHIFREAVRLGKELQGSPRRPDTIAALATNFRLHVEHARATGLDARLAAAVGRHMDRVGRDAFIDLASDPQIEMRHHKLLQSLGLGDLHVETGSLPRSAYEQGLTAILVGGVTPTLDRAASALEQLRTRIGRLAIAQNGVRVQLGCEGFRAICEFFKVLVAIICAAAAVDPLLVPICAVLAVESATACFLAWLGGC